MYDIAIIGGGAAGLMAAVECVKLGYNTAILEAADRVGKKILATGNGKCNFTHKTVGIDFYNTPAIKTLLDKFTPEKVATKFEEIGLLSRVTSDNYYPYSEQATSVLNALRVANASATIITDTKIVSIDNRNEQYELRAENGQIFNAKRVCFACGSKATMGIDSMSLLASMGYKVKPMRPSLLPILADKQDIKGMSGVRCKVRATIDVGDCKKCAEGEMLFKDNALSGIVSFCLSATLARSGQDECVVSIDFAPEYNITELKDILTKIGIENMYHKSIVAALSARAQGVGGMAKAIKNYEVNCFRNKDTKLAQVMSGGLELSQVNLADMSLKKHSGLYAIGEALDVDGECGGYNLHWAWASAMAFAEGLGYAK